MFFCVLRSLKHYPLPAEFHWLLTVLFPNGRFLLKLYFDKHSWWTGEQKNCTPGFVSEGDSRASVVKWAAAIRSVFTFTGSCEWHRISVCPWVPPSPAEALGNTQMDSVLHKGVIYIPHWRALQICNSLLAEFGEMRCCSVVCGLSCLKCSCNFPVM